VVVTATERACILGVSPACIHLWGHRRLLKGSVRTGYKLVESVQAYMRIKYGTRRRKKYAVDAARS
jgi:hypothetical protein